MLRKMKCSGFVARPKCVLKELVSQDAVCTTVRDLVNEVVKDFPHKGGHIQKNVQYLSQLSLHI